MIRIPVIALILLSSAAPVLGAQDDPRLVTRRYSSSEIVRVDGRTNVQQTIAFGDDEHIENVAIGDSASWQVTPNKRTNLLFVKPLEPRARTNMTVVTDRHTYLFDLVAGRGGRPVYLLRFTYPDEPRPDAGPKAAAQAIADAPAAVQAPVIDPAGLNFSWRARGSARLLPARIYDDGTFTYVSWAAGRPVPAILVRNAQGAEGPVNFSLRGDVIAVEGVPEMLVLRSGRDSATLERQAPAPKPATPVSSSGA